MGKMVVTQLFSANKFFQVIHFDDVIFPRESFYPRSRASAKYAAKGRTRWQPMVPKVSQRYKWLKYERHW